MIDNISGALTSGQIVLIVSLSAVAVCCLVALEIFAFYKMTVRRLKTPADPAWISRRDEILRRLADMRCGRLKFIEEPDEEELEPEVQDIVLQEDDDEPEEEEGVPDSDEDGEEDEESKKSRDVLSISKLSREARRKLDLREKEYDGKTYEVHYDYSFEARLRLSDDGVKNMYIDLMDDILNYNGFEVRSGYRKERVCIGKNLFAVIRFIGKTLCVAFALDPEKYTGSEYAGLNKLKTDAFAGTPLVVKLTSRRELDFAKYLLGKIAEANELERVPQPVPSDYDLSPLAVDELYLSGMLGIEFLKEISQ